MSLQGFWWGACLLVLVGCSVPSLEELQAERAVPITVNYTPSFKAGCIEIQMVDSATSSRSTMETIEGATLAGGTSPLQVRLRRGTGWGPQIQVTIRAREQTCTGKIVDEKIVLSPGTGAQSTLEVTLTTPDEDGDGYVAILNGGKGGTDCQDSGLNAAARFPGNPETCDLLDNNCNGAVDEGLTKYWYLDDDQDGFPRESSPIVHCSKPEGNYVEYAAGMPFDCNDDATNPTAFRMNPGANELCDGLDNNCVGGIDESFSPVSVLCNAECGGMTRCSADGLSVECSRRPGRYYFQDRDSDGDGAADATAVLKCEDEQPEAGYVLNNHGDCDDLDPARNSRRTEVCDAIDNNCRDGVTDEPASCGGTLKDVTDFHTGGNSHDWRTVSTGPNGYPVWIAGRGGKLAVRKAATLRFESFSFGDSTIVPPDGSPQARPGDGCGDRNWTASWVASNGHVFLAGEGGYVAIHDGTTCFGTPGVVPGVPNIANLTGVVGFENPHTLYLTDTDGRLIKWVLGASPAFTLVHDHNINYYGVHGLSAAALLVSGASTAGDFGQEFVSYINDTPSPLHTTLPDKGTGIANAVWMGRADKACAVGDGGVAWRWNGSTTWTRAEASGTTDSFSSVVMRFDAQNPASPLNDQCYIVDKGSAGKLRRLTPYGWASQMTLSPVSRANVPLRDIAITATGEIWIVGDDGRVFHYPEP